MHEVLVNRLGGLSLPRKSVVRLTDGPDMTLDVYCGRKTPPPPQQQQRLLLSDIKLKNLTRYIKKTAIRKFISMFYTFCIISRKCNLLD